MTEKELRAKLRRCSDLITDLISEKGYLKDRIDTINKRLKEVSHEMDEYAAQLSKIMK